MPGPFPGMDPFMELRWGDSSTRLIVYVAETLNRLLPDDLAAEIDCERYPLPGLDDPITDRSVHILPLRDDRPVTAITFVNPWNRVPGPGRTAYERRRAWALSDGYNVVEIELVRTGEPVVAASRLKPPAAAVGAEYRVAVTRASAANRVALYPVGLRDRLPVIAVPLRAGEADVAVGLQPLIDRVWEGRRNWRRFYARNCHPPLAESDAEWADALPASGDRALADEEAPGVHPGLRVALRRRPPHRGVIVTPMPGCHCLSSSV